MKMILQPEQAGIQHNTEYLLRVFEIQIQHRLELADPVFDCFWVQKQ